MADAELAADVDGLVGEWLDLPAVSEQLGVDVTRVRQMLRDGKLLAFRTAPGAPLRVPALFVRDGAIVKGLPGVLTVLRDAGYSDAESLRWLFTPEDTLPGTPAAALAENRGTEVKRRAQALGF